MLWTGDGRKQGDPAMIIRLAVLGAVSLVLSGCVSHRVTLQHPQTGAIEKCQSVGGVPPVLKFWGVIESREECILRWQDRGYRMVTREDGGPVSPPTEVAPSAMKPTLAEAVTTAQNFFAKQCPTLAGWRVLEAFEQDERRVYVVKAEEKCGGAEAVQHEIWVDVTTGQVTRTQLISGAK